MDPLTEVLRSVRLSGGVFLDSQFSAPWCILAHLSRDDCKFAFDTPTQLIVYHVVISGRFFLTVEGEAPVEVGAGEIVLLPRNDPHALASQPDLSAAVPASDLIQPAADGGLPRIIHGGGGAPTHIVCGFLGSDNAANPLISSLPRMLKLGIRDGTSRDWVEASVRFAAEELTKGRFASSNLMSRLSETLLVEAVRNYAQESNDTHVGWLRGAADPQIGRALALIHGDIRATWSNESLAKEVGMSRSAFVDRFSEIVGMPPIRYLTSWRLNHARLNLRETRLPIARLADQIGYGSEEAFSRAFKRQFGVSPAQWRDAEQIGPSA